MNAEAIAVMNAPAAKLGRWRYRVCMVSMVVWWWWWFIAGDGTRLGWGLGVAVGGTADVPALAFGVGAGSGGGGELRGRNDVAFVASDGPGAFFVAEQNDGGLHGSVVVGLVYCRGWNPAGWLAEHVHGADFVSHLADHGLGLAAVFGFNVDVGAASVNHDFDCVAVYFHWWWWFGVGCAFLAATGERYAGIFSGSTIFFHENDFFF